MIQSIEELNLKAIPFSRRHSRLFVIEAPVTREEHPEYVRVVSEPLDPIRGSGTEQGLFISYSYNVPDYTSRYELIQLIPVIDGKPQPYTYKAKPGLLTISAGGGKIEICFDGSDILRLRASGGLSLIFRMRFNMGEQFMDRLDGTLYAAFSLHGEYLFEPTKGSQSHNCKLIAPKMTPADTDVTWTPSADGTLDGYIKHADYSVNRPETLHDFDACVKETWHDFELWREKYAKVPEKYEQVGLLAIYVIWICVVGKRDLVTDDMIFMMRSGKIVKAVSWHPAYHAMAAYKDVDQAVKFLHATFTLQDEHGMIPDRTSDKQTTNLMTKPPDQGFALSYLIDRVGIDALTKEHCEMLYEPLCKWVGWWTTFRDTNRDGLSSYHHADESGWDDDAMFCKGLPLTTADLAAFLILCMEACSKLAGKLGLAEESEAWMKRSKDMLDKMIETLWNGEKFICILDATGEIVDEDTIALYQPIVLGKRLPQEIIDKIAAVVGDPDKFLSVNGIPSLSMQNRFFDVGMACGAFSLGLIHAPVQALLTVGLYSAGRKDVALQNARNYCDQALIHGLGITRRDLMGPEYLPYEGYLKIYPKSMFPGSLCSWGAAVFLNLAHLLNDEEERG